MKELLISTLSQLGYPVYLHGSLGANEPFPAAFFTFQTLASDDAFTYDDDPTHTAWEYQVIFYADNPQTVHDIAASSRTALKAAGFIPQGKGIDIYSDEPTHTGWVCNYKYISIY